MASWLTLTAVAALTACEAPARPSSDQDAAVSEDVATTTSPDRPPTEVMTGAADMAAIDQAVTNDVVADVGVAPLIKVELATGVAGRSLTISPGLRLSILGAQSVVRAPILTLRYWYTIDAPSSNITQSYEWDGILGLGDDGVAISFMPVVPPRPLADFYAELRFLPGAGDYLTGPYEFYFSVEKSDMSFYDQSNDYSYNGMLPPNGQMTERVTGYLDGKLIYGTEP
jgi:hypothetical protein